MVLTQTIEHVNAGNLLFFKHSLNRQVHVQIRFLVLISHFIFISFLVLL